jgi:RNA polymerase sigma-70 factor, ECF subfamily
MDCRGGGNSPCAMMDAAQNRTPAGADAMAPSVLDPRRLYDSHLAFVWRSLRRLGVPESMIEDAAQDVFLVVHRRWNSFDARRSAVETWLFGIVLRVASTYRRTMKRRFAWLVPLPGHEVVTHEHSQHESATELIERREKVALFERALGRLDERKRAVFLLVELEQFPVPQAAQALRINVNTAYWRLREARLEFRKALMLARGEKPAQEGGRKP